MTCRLAIAPRQFLISNPSVYLEAQELAGRPVIDLLRTIVGKIWYIYNYACCLKGFHF